MDCTYIYKGKRGNEINNILDLSREYHRSTRQLDPNAAIYSSEDVRTSTVNTLLALQANKTQIQNDESLMEATTFITNSDVAPILKSVGLKTERLNPEYIEENRIKEHIKKEMSIKNTSFDPKNTPSVNHNRYNKLRNNPEFESLSDAELKFHLSGIESILEFEEKTKKFGTLIHDLIATNLREPAGLNSKIYKEKLSLAINNDEEIFGRGLEAQWTIKINTIVQQINTLVRNIGHPITELLLASEESDKARIKGKIDLIAVDNSGTPHIFEIKISKTPYSEWNNVKTLGLDWQLALYRQLLSKHVDVSDTILYTIPIQLTSLGDPNSMIYTGAENRKSSHNSGLVEGGKITTIARMLIKNKIFIKYNNDRIQKLITESLPGLIPNYIIKTTKQEYDVDKIVENAIKKRELSIYNNFPNNPEFPELYIKANTVEEFRKKIERYVAYAKEQQHTNVLKLKEQINDVIKDPVKTTISTNNAKTTDHLNKVFKTYLTKNWEIVNIPEAINLGLIVFREINDGTIDIVSLSVYNNLSESSDLKGLRYGQLDHLKVFMFLNEYYKELYIGKGSKIGNIISYNPESGQSDAASSTDTLKLYIERMIEIGRKHEINLKPDIHLLGEAKMAINSMLSSYLSYEGSRQSDLDTIFKTLVGSSHDDIDLQKLLNARAAMIKKFPDIAAKNFDPNLNFSDPIEYLFTLLQVAILRKEGVNLHGDFLGMSKFALRFSDFKSLLASIYSREQSEYNKQEGKIQGMMGGLTQTTPDFVRSNDLRNINLMIANVNSKIGQKMVEQSYKLHDLTEKYWEDIGFKGIKRTWIGDTQVQFKNMFIQDNNQVSKEFKVKNPYKIDVENAMTDSERAYLKNMLFEIQKYMLNLKSDEISKINPESLDSLLKNETIANAIVTGEYFKIPLIRREELSRHKDLFHQGLHGFWSRFTGRMEEINDYIDARELNPEDLKNLKQSAIGFTEMYDVYGLQNDKYKANVLNKHGVEYFEWNLDTIAHRIAFNKIRKYQFDSKLPIISAYIWWIKLHGGKQNKELDKVIEYIQDQLKLAAFDDPIVDEEFRDGAKTVGAIKSITTASMLAFRPILMVKELSIGLMKGIGLAATQIYGKDQFTLNDLRKSYTKLLTIDNKFSQEWNVIDNINNFYRFANMDVNTLAKKLQTDRRGIMRGLNRWMYAMNTLPDYYNRLSLFLAKMIHDGSYEAHSMNGREMVYDVNKDKRFSYYLKNRSKHVNIHGDFIPAKNDAEYNKQRNLYVLLINQLNAEKGIDEIDLTEKDLAPKGYTEQERNSFKSFTDMAYGYYDTDSKSQLGNTFGGMIFLQFLSFWPGKMRQWFGKPLSAEESPMGKFIHKTTKENGKDVLMWRKPVYSDEDPTVIEYFEHVTENTGDPLMEWQGSYHEGLIYSLLYTAQEAFIGLKTGDFSKVTNNEQRNRMVGFAIHDAALMMLFVGLIKALIDGLLADGAEGVNEEILQFASAASNKVLRETNVYENTLGALSLTPVSVSWAQRVSRDVENLMLGTKSVKEVLGSNVGALEFWKERRI